MPPSIDDGMGTGGMASLPQDVDAVGQDVDYETHIRLSLLWIVDVLADPISGSVCESLSIHGVKPGKPLA